MAVIIQVEPKGDLLNAYNNSIIEFTTDVGLASRAVVTVGEEYIFEITPNKNVFFINLKEIVKVLVNQDNFQDLIEVKDSDNYIYPDNNLYKEIPVSISVFKRNGSKEVVLKTYKYCKSVKQIVRAVYKENDLIKILSPSSDITSYLTYYKGYPFDMSIFSNINRTVTVTHKRTSTSRTISLLKGVNRLFISNGENDSKGFEEQLPLYIGVNELELKIDNDNKLTLFVTKKNVDCGVYLKWFNQSGSWSYWKFSSIVKESVKTKSAIEINSDYANIEQSVSRTFQVGKQAVRRLRLQTERMTERERLVVSEIFTSPKVYYYNNIELQPFSLTDWKEVVVKTSSIELSNSKNNQTEYSIDIELPQEYTQTYAG